MMGSGVGRADAAPVPHDVQTSLDVIEEVGNRIEVIASGGKCSEDGKINKNDGNKDRDNIDGVTEEGGCATVADSDATSLGLSWKSSNLIKSFLIKSKDCWGGKYKDKQEFVHCEDFGWGIGCGSKAEMKWEISDGYLLEKEL